AVGAQPRLLHRLERVEDGDEPAGVVGDAGGEDGVAALGDGDVGLFGEDGIEVPDDGDAAPADLPARARDDVPDLVDIDAAGAGRAEQLGVLTTPDLLLEGGRRDLGQHAQVLQRSAVGGFGVVERLADD